jgi:hypothetical protein
MADPQEDAARININALVGKTDLTYIDPALYAHDDEAILANLRDRFNQDILYTRAGLSTLIALNPFKQLPGGGAKSSAYELEALCNRELSPHPYEIASSAYLHMVRATEDQAILTRYVFLSWSSLRVLLFALVIATLLLKACFCKITHFDNFTFQIDSDWWITVLTDGFPILSMR